MGRTLWNPLSERNLSQNKKKEHSSSNIMLLFRNNTNEIDYDEIYQNRFVTQLVLPEDTRTSYRGNTVDVKHSLIVNVDTASRTQCITTPLPELSFPFQIQPRMPTFVRHQEILPPPVIITPTAPSLYKNQHPIINTIYALPLPTHSTTTDTIPIAVAELLPDDWNAQKSEVIRVISPQDIISPKDIIEHRDTKFVTSSSLEQTAPPVQPSAPSKKILV